MTATYDLTFAVAALTGVVNLVIIGSLGIWLARDKGNPAPLRAVVAG
jgi:hypothetical protein